MKKELIYTAGLFDCEGSVTLTRGHKTAKFRTPVAELSSTTKELVEYLKNTFGGCICNHKPINEKWKHAYNWRVSYDNALEFLKQIRPYIKVPEKTKRIDLLLKEYRKVTKRNGKYTQEEMTSKLNFERHFLEIGGRAGSRIPVFNTELTQQLHV